MPFVLSDILPKAPARAVALYLLGYVLLDRISYIYPAIPPLAVTPWNPPPGLSLAFLLRYGPSNAPWVFVAVVVADLLVRGLHLSPDVLLGAALLVTAAYTGLALTLRNVLRIQVDFTQLRDAVLFLFAVAVTTGVLALAMVALWRAAGLLGAAQFAQIAAQFWIGDLLGVVIMTPLLLVLTRRPRPVTNIGWTESLLQLTSILLAIWLIFGSGLAQDLKLFYVLFLPLIWIAMRHEIEGAVVASAVIQFSMILTMWFAHYRAETVLDFQVLLLAIAVTGLILGMTVSERREADAKLRMKQAELDRSLRLAGAAEMASALAHELNQPLTAIGNYVNACQLIIEKNQTASVALRQTLTKVADESIRAGSVVRKLREFFRTGASRLAPTDLAPLLYGSIDAARQRLDKYAIESRVEAAPGLPIVLLDRVQIEMVLHNLIANAIDALSTAAMPARRLWIRALLDDPRTLRISVGDNGPGIAPDVAAHLFSPFATAKADGMGLGLTICRSIVDSHGGQLSYSTSNGDTVFSFTLPVKEST
jgi:signal transduction histidine kinase